MKRRKYGTTWNSKRRHIRHHRPICITITADTSAFTAAMTRLRHTLTPKDPR